MPDQKPKTESPAASRQSGLTGIGAPMAVGTVAVQAWVDIGAEAVRFVWDRLQQDIKIQQAMLACTSLEEMQTVQAAFFTAAQEQYTAEAGKMLDLMGKAASGLTASASASTTARRYDDVPL
jgi:hypothetical protein